MLRNKLMGAAGGSPTDPDFNNASLLLHGDGTNGSQSFPDNSNNSFAVTANGNAQVSTAVKKYGTGSMYFDGNGDYLTIPYSTELKLSSGDWTIEFWIYCTGAQSSASNAIWMQDITGSNYTGIIISANSSRQVQFTSSQTGSSWTYLFQTIGAYSDNTWSHVAICKSNTNVYGFFNGNKNLTLSGFPSTIFSSSDPSAIGVYASNYFNGYIDDLRITKGVARYTANFTPPTQAFPNQ